MCHEKIALLKLVGVMIHDTLDKIQVQCMWVKKSLEDQGSLNIERTRQSMVNMLKLLTQEVMNHLVHSTNQMVKSLKSSIHRVNKVVSRDTSHHTWIVKTRSQ